MKPASILPLVLGLLASPAAGQILFAPPQPHPLGHPVRAPLAGDVDFDGDVDVLVQGQLPGAFQVTSLSVLLGEGGGALGEPMQHGLSLSPVGEGQIADVADFDGPTTSVPDGLPDVLLGGVGFGNGVGIGWLEGDGAGGFGSLSGFNLSGAGFVDVAAADLEGDGDLDLVGLDGGASIFIPGQLVQGLALGGGGFAFSPVGSTQTSASFLALADLDADGRAEALCNNDLAGVISVFAGKAAGGFLPAVGLTTGGAPRELAAADLDGDGDADVLAANPTLDAVQVLLGNGQGGLAAPVAQPSGESPTRLAVGDLDGDGAADALVSAANGEVIVLHGAGDGSLLHVATVSGTSAALGLALADLDGDGDLDATLARGGAPGRLDVLVNETYPAGSPFADLGHALAGSAGYPVQIAEGSLLPGEPFGFHLLSAKPGAPATHVIGLSPLFAPYKGGTLVPTPDLLNVVATDAEGEVHLVGPWPAGGSGATLWMQFWVQDPGGPKGRAASSALTATIP